MVDLPSGFVSSIQAFLPEGKAISSSLISTKAWDPNFFFDFKDTPGFTEGLLNRKKKKKKPTTTILLNIKNP